jgi:hypothetical protein
VNTLAFFNWHWEHDYPLSLEKMRMFLSRIKHIRAMQQSAAEPGMARQTPYRTLPKDQLPTLLLFSGTKETTLLPGNRQTQPTMSMKILSGSRNRREFKHLQYR